MQRQQFEFFVMPLYFFLSFALASCIEPRKYQSSLRLRVSLQEQASINPDQGLLSFMSVRDIFHRYNCVVCHRQKNNLDLRRYPFWSDGALLSSSATQTMLEQLDGASIGHQDLPWLKTAENNRLLEWLERGAAQDPSSPLKKQPDESFQGSIVVQYKIAGQTEAQTEIPLSFNRQEQVYTGVIIGLTQGVWFEAKIVLKDTKGLFLWEQPLQELILEAETDKLVVINLPLSSAS
jgi:hypothetical protein